MPDAGIPGMELVEQGIADLRTGRVSAEALLVEIAAPRLRAVGVDVPPISPSSAHAEIRLYELLGRQGHLDPYSLYNSLLARLASCTHELERAARRSLRMAGA